MNDHRFERVPDGEKVLHLYEYDTMTDQMLVRWQEIAAIHNDRVCKHLTIMGPSQAFTCGPIKALATTISSNGKLEPVGDTAGDLRELADAYRESKRAESIIDEKRERSTLIEQWHRFNEMKQHIAKTHARTIRNLELLHA